MAVPARQVTAITHVNLKDLDAMGLQRSAEAFFE
jgi:hypothetical protein